MKKRGQTVRELRKHIKELERERRRGEKAFRREQEKRLNERFKSQNTALSAVASTSEKRFEGVNEFRAALSDYQRLLLPRAEAMALIIGISTIVGIVVGAVISLMRGMHQ